MVLVALTLSNYRKVELPIFQVSVIRRGDLLEVDLIPKRWSGPGTVGCMIKPIKTD